MTDANDIHEGRCAHSGIGVPLTGLRCEARSPATAGDWRWLFAEPSDGPVRPDYRLTAKEAELTRALLRELDE